MPVRCLHTEHAKGPASHMSKSTSQDILLPFCREYVHTVRLLIAAETPEIRVSFIEPATNRGTMDDKRSGHSCHNQLVAQTHTSLGRQTFCLPKTLLKPHSYSRDAAPSYMYMISQFWEGPPVCTAQGPRQQARVICSPTSWQRQSPHNHECPPTS